MFKARVTLFGVQPRRPRRLPESALERRIRTQKTRTEESNAQLVRRTRMPESSASRGRTLAAFERCIRTPHSNAALERRSRTPHSNAAAQGPHAGRLLLLLGPLLLRRLRPLPAGPPPRPVRRPARSGGRAERQPRCRVHGGTHSGRGGRRGAFPRASLPPFPCHFPGLLIPALDPPNRRSILPVARPILPVARSIVPVTRPNLLIARSVLPVTRQKPGNPSYSSGRLCFRRSRWL